MKYNIPLPRVLDANGNELRRLNVIDASVSLSLVPLSTAQIVLPIFENLNMREWVQMFTSQGSAGVFRVRSPGQNYRMETKQYTLDHGIVELSDHVIKTEVEFNDAANSVITSIFSHYNGSMWQLGTVVPTQKVEYSGDHEDILTALMYVMDQLPDYMMQFDQTVKPWTLNIVSRPQTVTGEGRLSRNVVSARVSEDDSRLCTRILSPSLPNGQLDADTIGTYGVVERFFGKDDEQPQEEFVADCNKYLAQHKTPLLSVNLELRDLEQITGEALDNITVGDLYRLALPDYNTTIEQPVISLSWRSVYGDPGAVSVTLAHEEMTMSSAFSAVAGAGGLDGSSSLSKANQKIIKQEVKLRKTSERVENAYDILDEAFIEIEAQGVTIGAQTQTLDLLGGRVAEAEASITVQSNQIQSKVSQTEFTALGERVSSAESSITQTASEIRSEVSNAEQGLYSYVQQTASALRQSFVSTSNRTIVNDTDPRGATYTPKEGDIWIESVHDGTWDGADGFDWEHDEDYDWTQVQGAKVWTWKNNQWQLVADRQQLVNYSDFVNTADLLISQKITALANEEGMIEVYRSLIEQTGEQIRSEVYSATSDIYSYVRQTASNIAISLGGGAHVVTQDAIKDGQPIYVDEQGNVRVSEDGYVLKDGDIWIDTANQNTWDAALEWNWNDDAVYDWSELRDDDVYVYSAELGQWVKRVNGRVYTDAVDLDITNDHITANMRSIDVVNGKVEENAHQLSVTTQELRSTFNDRISAVGSELLQTKSELRSEYYASNSQIYSQLIQTASSLTSRFENEIENVGSSITQTASEIRSEVHAANSTVWSSIKQNADNIELKVSKNGIVSAINQTAESIKISASKINLDGYVTATQLDSTNAAINNLISGNATASRLVASSGNFSNLEITNALTYGGYGDLKKKIINGLSSSTSGGAITISSTTLDGSAGPSVNFNIADTQYYKDGVSAAKDDRSVTSANFSLTNVTEYPSSNMVAFNVVATANDGTTYTSNLKSVTYTGSGGGGGGGSVSDVTVNYVSVGTVTRIGGNRYAVQLSIQLKHTNGGTKTESETITIDT